MFAICQLQAITRAGCKLMTALPSELQALLAACRAAPADDVPRFVLADWLDENGDSDRATLIRVQCELSHPTSNKARKQELRGYEHRLLKENGFRWMAGLDEVHEMRPNPRPPQMYDPPQTHIRIISNRAISRGLIEVGPPTPDWLSKPEMHAWLQTPIMAWVEEIILSFDGLASFMRAKIPTECTGRMSIRLQSRTRQAYRDENDRLQLSAPTSVPTPIEWRDFIRCPNFYTVRSIRSELGGEVDFLRELGGVDVSRLVHLGMDCGADADAAATIIATTPFTSLSSLRLGPMSAQGVTALTRSPYLRSLYELDLTGCHMGDEGIIALVESPLAESLGVVSFQNKGMTDRGLTALVRSPLFHRMAGGRLNLMMNQIGDEGLKILAESEVLLQYRELAMRENFVSNDGATALAESPNSANLEFLDFWRNQIGDAGAVALAESPHLAKVIDLSLKENLVGPIGQAALESHYGDRAKS